MEKPPNPELWLAQKLLSGNGAPLQAWSDQSGDVLVLGDWYHKPEECIDLSAREWASLEASEQATFVAIHGAEDLGEDLEGYIGYEESDEDGSSEEGDEEDDEEEEHKMALVVRQDLKMGKGKMCAQCGHASLGGYKRLLRRASCGDSVAAQRLSVWESQGQAKIALKAADEAEMDSLQAAAQAAGLPVYSIRDAGRTQIEAGSKTVLAIGPAAKSLIDGVVGHCKLL